MIKLNLGCNKHIKEGYINVDKDMYPGVDKICDVSKLDFKDSSVDEIYASHVLEHFGHAQTMPVLTEWYRVLKEGGIIKIAVPDFRRTIEIYIQCGMTDWIVNYLWGDQGYEGANHFTGFDENRLRAYLKQAGFIEICRVSELPGSVDEECSNNISYFDNLPVSLNMVAIK